MILKISGNCFSNNIYKEIEAITNHGILNIRGVNFDKNNNIVSIPLERIKITSTKKAFFGIAPAFKYDRDIRIPSLIIVKNVTDCKIENNLDTSFDKIHILFGLSITPEIKEIYIGSVEENRGVTCYSMKLKVSEFDIEIKDQDKII